uniref:Reverse transcriptase domain-containing protein n=1 Tax=Micrurus spixii TaxID=129469 RepID=A0A2D4NGC4_9SAUR
MLIIRSWAMIISERLKKILSKIIHSDQNGFLPNRQMKTNTRLIMDVLECYEMHSSKPMVLMFLDAQNAFDTLNWNQLTNMKFGENFVGLIKTIYKVQMSKVIVNGETMDGLEINKGMRQGCPLAPLLYILSQVLSQIRQNRDIKGLNVKKEENKL